MFVLWSLYMICTMLEWETVCFHSGRRWQIIYNIYNNLSIFTVKLLISRGALHDTGFKIIILYLILNLCTASGFILCLKQGDLIYPCSRKHCFNWLLVFFFFFAWEKHIRDISPLYNTIQIIGKDNMWAGCNLSFWHTGITVHTITSSFKRFDVSMAFPNQ